MLKKLFITIIILSGFIFSNTILFGQTQLVQSFMEQNSTGKSFFGSSVATAGDVNNDGVIDVIVGAPGFNSNTGRVYIYFGGNSADTTADVILDGEDINYIFGSSVSYAGDVNNDGFDDVIVGSIGYSGGDPGRAYIYFGGNPMDNTPDIILTGEAGATSFGTSVSNAGDVNNDGFQDVIIGAEEYDSRRGRAYIYFGGLSMDSVADVGMEGEATGDFFGASVSSAKDVNKDGFDDVIIGAYGYNNGTGRAYIFYGGVFMDGTADVTLTGEATANYFGYSISAAGDVNNDSFPDVVIGALGFNSFTGKAYVYYGGANMDNIYDGNIIGEGSGNEFGISVAGAGDVNKDGFDDIAVGAPGYNNGSGRVYIYNGGNTFDSNPDFFTTGPVDRSDFGSVVSLNGDINNDGFDDLIIGVQRYMGSRGRAEIYFGGNSMDNVVDLAIDGELTDNSFGYSVSSAGDVNNDGFEDVIVGAKDNAKSKGAAYIFFGGNSIDNNVDVTIYGENPGDLFGGSVSCAGDVNNDGYDDVIVGADIYNSSTNSRTSRAYIYFGGNPMDNIADVVLNGETSNNYSGILFSVSGAGDLNNDGYDDVIVGAAKYNYSAGRAYIYFGGNQMDNQVDILLDAETTNSGFGISVSKAGDVNNDGFADVIVGANLNNASAGAAYIYFGGNPMNNVFDVKFNGETISKFGGSVSWAGDINNDGFDDVIVGANEYSSNTGRAYIYYGGSSMDNIADFTLTGLNTGDNYGCSVSGGYDANNDGFADIIVGARGYNSSSGQAYIYYGGSSINSAADNILTGASTNSYFGSSVSVIGSGNFIVGAYGHPVNGKAYLYKVLNKPVVNLSSPTSITSNSATLNGVVNPNGDATTYYFSYGTDPANLTQTTSTQSAGSGSLDVSVNANISGLIPETLYYYSLTATNSGGTNITSNQTIFCTTTVPSTNLTLRLRADNGVISNSSLVSEWKDLSNNDNNALQSTESNKPTIQTNVINGQPVIRFNGSSSSLLLPAASLLGIQNSDYEMFIVTKSSNVNTQFLISSTNEQYEIHLNGAAGIRFIPKSSTYIDKGVSGEYCDNSPHVFSARASSTSGTVRVDGIDGADITADVRSGSNEYLVLGKRVNNTLFLDGDIAEVIIYNSILSDSDRSTVEHYLADRYSITSSALPVELVSFSANVIDEKVKLKWETATEVNNYGFEVQRIIQNWEKIGFVPGHGNSNSPKDYEFIDTSITDVIADLSVDTLEYRLKQIDTDGSYTYYSLTAKVDVRINDETLLIKFELFQNYPNPFNPSTVISYQLPVFSNVQLKIYDMLGREVALIVDKQQSAGSYSIVFNAAGLSTGTYIYKLICGKFISNKKLLLIK